MVRVILLFLLFFIQAQAEEKKHIFILHSYSQEYSWTKVQHENFINTLQKSCTSPLDISVEYLDTKRLTFSPEYQAFFLSYLQKKYLNYSPDAIYTTDDNALNFFINHHNALFSKAPLFFSGVNNLNLISKLDPTRYTGVYETKDIVPNIELIRQFSPQTRDIWIVGDDSTTYRSIESDIRSKIGNYPKHTFHFLASSKIDEIRSKLPQSPKTFVLLTTIGGLCDAKGVNLTLKESISLLKQNQNLILCSMEDVYIQSGVVGGFVTSSANQGIHSAKLLLRFLHGESLQNIPSIIKSPNVYMFDRHALMESRLILSEYIARNAIILHEDKTFFERYQQVILNTIFIFFLLFLIFLVFVFFITSQKNSKMKHLQESLDGCSSELKIVKEKLSSSNQSYE